MKKRIVLLILGFAYIGLFALLLLSLMQISFLGGTPGKWRAALGTLVIGVPWLIVLRLYIYVKESSPSAEADQTRALSHEIIETIMSGYGLTGRESEIAWLVYKGYTNRQIGEELFIAETTVKKHVSHIYEKMQVSGRKEFRAKVNELPH